MAFWGTEVKPGRPFTHAPLNGNARLHLSGATLGIGSATQKSIVQCNVGNKRPVFVCCLFPEKAEFCQLNLEFEESNEFIFSVIGPRTVHLTGYYQSSSSLNHHKDDESESYGEDIGETDTEESENSQESEYGGSFINDDDDLQVFPSSPDSSAPLGSIKKSKDGKGRRRRLRKSYQLIESENDNSFQQKHFNRAAANVIVLDSELEDKLPISSLSRAKHASNSGKIDVEEKAKKETVDLTDNEAEDDATKLDGTNAAIGAQPGSESSVRNEEKANKEKGNLNNNEAEDETTMLDRTNAAIGAQPEWNEEKAKKEKGNLNNNEAEDYATMLEGTNAAIGAQPESESGVRNEEKAKKEKGNLNNNEAEDDATMLDGTNAAIDAQPECESGVGKEEKSKKEKSNLNNNEAEDDATMLDGTNAAIGAQPASQSGIRNDEKAKKEKGNLNNNEAEDDATMLDGTNAAIGAQPESESGVGNEEKSKKEKSNLNNNEAEDDATMLDGTNAAIGAQPECESGARNEEKVNLNNNEAEDGATMLDGTNAAIGAQPDSESGVRIEEKQKHVLGVVGALMPKNKTEELAKEERLPEGAHGMIGEVVSEQNEPASKDECEHNDLLLAASQVCPVDGAKLKRKRKKHIKEKTLKDNASNEDERRKSGSNLDAVTQDVHLEDKATQKQGNDKKRKKKKRCQSKEDGAAMKMEPTALSANRKEGSVVEMDGKNANDSATQLANGIIIEDLEMGKPDGKVASLGKKVRVHYIGKLKESGQVFDSSAGKPPSKFRLGEEKVPELWNVGLDGMRVGGKRRLTVPPSVSYRNDGDGENIPPNSWLVFDVELVKVR